MVSLLVAIVVAILQGIVEWLPISSEGNVALVLAALGSSPDVAVRLSLFLHLGTGLAATAYYRGEVVALLSELSAWRPSDLGSGEWDELTFLGVATAISGVVAIGSYVLLLEAATELSGAAFVAVIGVLLILTGVVQRTAGNLAWETDRDPGALDAVLTGVGQGLAILPGVSRSGTTVSVLLLRGHDAAASFRLSFLLSIPAAFGASLLAVGDGGLGLAPSVAVAALAVSAVVGYLTMDALLRVVRRVAFWAVCVGLGGLAVGGGVLLWFA